MAPIARAENVLQRAEELVKMDKAGSALELLYDTINSKRTRFVSLDWQEPVVLKFIELSVDLRSGKNVRDVLYQYKKMTAPNNVGALATAVEKFLAASEKKVSEAQAEAKQITIDEEDLEAEQSPEDLLLSTVSAEQTKDRTDREVVTPWLKFLWEGYRSVLDVLRNNSKLEKLYAKVVNQAFQFCLQYQRKTEFRRLCELLRNHLVQAAQQARQPNQANLTNPIDLHDPETLQLYLGTRFEQLKIAVKLELWQEAFRSIEDIHTLFLASRRPIKINSLATYYETLARICAVSNNHLFHAASWAKYYGMVYNTRETAPEGELERIASVFYLSVLCIPSNSPDLPSRQNRLTSLLNMTRVPTRDSLIEFALGKNVLNYVRPEIRDLNRLLEADFHPLTLKRRLGPILESLGKVKAFHPYVKPLLDVIISRVFVQLSQSYTTLKLDFIVDIVTFEDQFALSRTDIEKMLVLGSHSGNYRARISHKDGTVTFDDSLNLSTAVSIEDVLEPTPATLLRNKLRDLNACISSVVPLIDDSEQKKLKQQKTTLINAAERGLEKENNDFLNRKKRQKELLEKAQKEQRLLEAQQAEDRARKLKEQKEAEIEREKRAQADLAREQIMREQKAIDDAKKRKLAEDINSKGLVQVDLDKLDDFTVQTLQEMQVKQLAKESEDLRTRMRTVARRQDHFERALREKEAEIWTKDADSQLERDRAAWEARKATIVNTAKARVERIQIAVKRYERMVPQYNKYMDTLLKERKSTYEKQKVENDELLEKAKAELVEKAKAEREEAQKREKEAEERRQAEEAARAERAAAHAAANPFGSARPAPTGLGAKPATPSSYKPPQRSSPFGNATPVSSSGAAPNAAPKASSPFGAARPTATGSGAKPNPFGAAKPASSPFGAAKPASTGPGVKASPFGAARPAPTGAGAKPSPFGAAKPAPTGPGAKPSPFGAAKPTTTGAPSKDANSDTKSDNKSSGGAWKPSFMRK